MEEERRPSRLGVRHLFVFLGEKGIYFNFNGEFSTFHILISILFSGFLGFANVYAMRVNLSVAIVYMAGDNKTGDSLSVSGERTFGWSHKQQGVILGMFFYGYVLTQLPGGRLAELFGGKWLFGTGESIKSIQWLSNILMQNNTFNQEC